MKKLILSTFLIFAASLFSSIFAQVEPPAGAGDKSLRDDDIRLRSVEIERIKREADKSNTVSPLNSEIDTKYPEIKEDFEGMQMSQSAIIKAYSTGENVDYKQIKTSAEEIIKNAKRLDSNLFSSNLEKKEISKKENEKAKSIKDMIVDLDNAIGDFTTSAMFQNLRVVDPEVARKAQLDLANIMEIGDKLSETVSKMK